MKSLILSIALALISISLIPSCGTVTMNPAGCLESTVTRDGMTYRVETCPAVDADGEASIERISIYWTNDAGDALRGTLYAGTREYRLEYLVPPHSWVGWSSKSGVLLGPVPPEIRTEIEDASAPSAVSIMPDDQ